MEMRGGFMPRGPPRDRGALLRHGLPLRGRPVMLMDRMRLAHHRPGLIRGALPPFRGLPPPRSRGMGPVMLRPPPMPLPGPMGPRGLMPRPMMPGRPPLPELPNLVDPSANIIVSANGSIKGNNRDKDPIPHNKINQGQGGNQQPGNRANRGGRNNRNNKNNQNAGPHQQIGGLKKPRKDNKNRRVVGQQSHQLLNQQQIQIPTQPAVQQSNQSPLPNVQLGPHPLQQPLPQQNIVSMNQPPMQKHMPPMQPQMNAGMQTQPQQYPMSQPAIRGGRNDMNHRNQGNAHMGTHVGPNGPLRSNVAPIPPRGNALMNGPPPPVQYSTAPPSTYAAPPPLITQQIPMKRAAPPIGPPVMQPKRIRYEPPIPTNGFNSYQQQQPPPPLQQQPVYSGYDVPQPTEIYSNVPPCNYSIPPQQTYNTTDYNSYPVSAPPQVNTTYSGNVNPQYSTSYNNSGNYSTYPTSAGYEPVVDYSTVPVQQTSNTDPYGYSKPVSTVDSYGYSNTTYTAPQTGYEDYSSGYVDQSGYAQPVQDPSYGQSVGTYTSYSY